MPKTFFFFLYIQFTLFRTKNLQSPGTYISKRTWDQRLYAAHYFIIKIPNKKELQQRASNHSSNIGFKDFIKLYKNYTKEPYSFLANDSTLSLDNPSRFRRKLL